MRAILTLIFCMAAGVQAATPAPGVVDLTKPGALEQVARENPEHYRQIVEMIRIAEQLSCEKAVKLYHANFKARDIDCVGLMILTSDPPKRRLGFTLDTTKYMTVVTIKTSGGKLIPAK